MIKKLQEAIEKGRAQLAKVYEQAGDDMDFSKVTEFSGTDQEKVKAVRALNDDMTVKGAQLADLMAIAKGKELQEKADADAVRAGRPGVPEKKAGKGQEQDAEPLSLGSFMRKHGAFEKGNYDKEIKAELSPVELKTLFQRSAGWNPESLRSGRLVPYAVRPPNFFDVVPQIPTSMAAYKYMDETTLDDSLVVEKAEGNAAGEMELALTERSVTIEKIPAALPVTDEQLEDQEGIEAYVNLRLTEALRRRASDRGINGTGVTPLVLGVINKSGIQTTAAAQNDAIADHIARAIKDVRVTGRAFASHIILNPTDWLTERLRKTVDGAYIWGNPGETGLGGMWGLPIVQDDSLAAGKAVIGDFATHSLFVARRDIVIKVGYYNDDILKGRQMVVASLRGAFVWDRAAAFNYITLPTVA